MDNLVLADDYRANHRFAANFTSELDSLCKRDYKGKTFFQAIIRCLDMDGVESSFKKSQPDCTMDAAIGVGTYFQNQVRNKRFALVELRLGYDNPLSSKDYDNMSKKIAYTKVLLSGSKVHQTYYFIFSTQLAPRVENEIGRKARVHNEYKNWSALSPADFLNVVNYGKNWPYVPVHNINNLNTDLNQSFNHSIENFQEKYDYWIGEAEKCEDKYDRQEAKALISYIQKALSNLHSNDENMSCLLELMNEDIERRIGLYE